MMNKYRFDKLFVYLDGVNFNAKYKICDGHNIAPSPIRQLIPLCSLFFVRTEAEMAEIRKYKLSIDEILAIEYALNHLKAENLYVAPVKVKNDKPETMLLLLTWDGTGRDSPRRPYFPQYLSVPYVDYDRQHLIKLSNLFNIKSENINPLQVLFLNQVISSPKFNKRFQTYLNKIIEEEKKIESTQDLLKNSNKQKDKIIANDFEKFMLY